ncbi:serine/threonine protein kinase [Geodermatophilus bullaregiensis]|uniref:serine/threonine-protein kinase n=1 Tax=Geodermatophilus bullaregiensis TaxID=1564160 RepID=UPI0019583D26|nr:serine/threonine-protein kinase [Geodermatophilus bullaregiensis]MBM7807671.1 serine/threonine protein kinase [Geodermatophilus bullaregiensis]
MLRPGDVFAGYRIQGVIGEGGSGAVYLAAHPRLPRQDALKVLHRALSRHPAYVTRFQREADVACRLDHPSVVAVHDRGMEDGQLWIAMQYVQGTDLGAVLRSTGPLSPRRALAVVGAVGDALDHAHTHGLVHRDVKPDNILLSRTSTGPERVMLTDFGIAAVTGGPTLTVAGSFVATMAYAPLEQLESRGVDGRTDLYALGAVLHELLTGVRPYAGLSLEAVYAAKVRGEVPDLRARRPDLPPGLAEVVRRAMAPDPADRFRTCGELAAAAKRALDPPPPPWQPRGTVVLPQVPPSRRPPPATPRPLDPPTLPPGASAWSPGATGTTPPRRTWPWAVAAVVLAVAVVLLVVFALL